jgi:hypothetical protein
MLGFRLQDWLRRGLCGAHRQNAAGLFTGSREPLFARDGIDHDFSILECGFPESFVHGSEYPVPVGS